LFKVSWFFKHNDNELSPEPPFYINDIPPHLLRPSIEGYQGLQMLKFKEIKG